jgi:hypothetical protein
MKLRKIAISLAIVGAIAAPFLLRTYNLRPTSETWMPLTADRKDEIDAELKSSENCKTVGYKNLDEKVLDALELLCRRDMRSLEEGGELITHLSALKYLAINTAAAIVGFVSFFCLTFLLPAIVRRYWRWLNT